MSVRLALSVLLLGACAHRVEDTKPAATLELTVDAPEPDGSGPEPADGCAEQDYATAITQSTTFNAWSLAHALRSRELERAHLVRRSFQLGELAARPRAPGEVLEHQGKKYVVLEIDWDAPSSGGPQLAMPAPPGPRQTVLVAKNRLTNAFVLVEASRIDRCNRTSLVPICHPAQGIHVPGQGVRVSATVLAVEVPTAPTERVVLEYAGSEISGARYVRDLSCPPAP